MNGFELNIGTEMLKRMDEADKKLQQIASHSEEVSKAMKKLSTDGINSVVNGLSQMSTQLAQLSKNKGFSNMGTQANQSVDAINKLVEALAKLTTQQQLRLQTQQAKVDYKKEANDLKELAFAEDERARALNRQNKANVANDKHRQALETKKLANDTKELMNIEQERGRQLILQNQKNIAAYTKQSVKLKQQINEINRLAKAYRQMPTNIKQVDLNKIITSASKAKTINQHIVAIHNLKNALKDLDTTSKKYKDNVKKINEEITRNKIELAKLGVSLDSVKRKKHQLMDTAGQLQRSLALVFSISHISGYINKLVNIRREMELQHRSLQVLIQDRFKADELWQQTLDLAVRSPFRVKELVTYTRQLAAYRIETDRLHDTTRRLADVSAGLGVDMNRLILAYGQVRAAEYLRGTELRQFSEAGIPMLDELAKHFEQLEGRAVSAGDVFERVSKRMVSFEDVDEVFQRMTNKGGVFFQMQEKQSETLHGIISNFHDSIDLMLNDLGEANDGFLKGTVLLFRGFVQNWRAFAEILTQIGTAAVIISLYRGISKLVALSPKIYAMAGALTSLNVANKAISVSMMRLSVSLKALGAAMLTPQGLIIGLVAAVASAISGFISWGKAVDAANAKFDKMSEREVNSINELNRLNEKIKENNKIIEDNNSKVEEKTKAEKDNAKTLDLLKNKYPDVYKGLVAQKNGTIDASNAVEHYNNMLRVNIALQQQAKGGKFQDTFSENYEEALADYQSVVSGITRVQSQALQGIVNATILLQKGTISQSTFEEISKILGKLSTAETFEDLKLLNNELVAFQNTLLSNQREYSTIIKSTASLREAYSDLYSSQGSYNDSLNDWYGNLDNQMDAFIVGVQNKLKNAANETIGKSLAGDWITSELKKLGAVNDELLKKAQIYVKNNLPLGIDVTFEEDGHPVYDLKESWRKKIWSAIEAVQASNPDIRLGVTLKEMATKDRSELIRKIQESVDNAIGINDKTINVGELPFQVAFTDEQIQNAKNAKPLLDFLAQLVGLWKEGSKSSTKDWWSEMAKGIQNLRKDFVDLNKTFDENEAKQIALERHLGVLKEIIANLGEKGKGIDLGSINFTTEQGTIDALNLLKNILPKNAKEARVNIEKALSDITGTIRIRDKESEDKKLIDQIEDMFSGYEMSIELQKLNIPKDLAKQLFNVDSVDLSSIRNKISSELAKAQATGGQEDRVKELKKQLDKVEELEDKAMQERLKKYTKYLVKAQGERVKIKLDEIQQLQEIEDTFKLNENVGTSDTIGMTSEEWKAYDKLVKSGKQVNRENLKEIKLRDELIDKILEYNDQMRISAKIAKEGVRKETQEKMDKAVWEDFKGSVMYEQLFSDLEHLGSKSIDMLLAKLRNMKEALKSLPPEVYKEIQTQISKLEELQIERTPFAKFKEYFDEVEKLNKNTETFTNEQGKSVTLIGEDAIAYRLQLAEAEAEKHRKNIELYEQIKKANGDINKLKEAGIELTDEQNNLLGDTKKLDELIAKEQGDKKDAKNKAKDLGLDLEKYKKARKATEGIESKTKAWGEAIIGVLDGMDAVLDAFGVAEDDSARLWIESAKNIANMIMQTILLTVALKAMGVAANSALGVIGWIATALQAVAMIFASIFAAGDKRKERQIERELALVKKLERSYEDLQRAVEKGYSIDFYRTSANRIDALKQQQEAYERMIEAERAKKKTDEDRISEWLDTIHELNNEIEDAYDELKTELVGDFKDYSDQLADAMIDALKKGEDGIEAWGQKVDEIIDDIVTKLLVTKFLEPKIADLVDQYYADIMPKTSEAEKKRAEYEKLYNEYLENQEILNTEGLWSSKGWEAVARIKQIEKDLEKAKQEYEKALKESEGEIPTIDKDATNAFEQGLKDVGIWFQQIIPDWLTNQLQQGDLSGLQRGIQGVTEETAQIIEAYLNSIRFFVAENNNYLAQIASSFSNTEVENPMVEQLRIIAAQTSAINSLLQGLVRGGHSLGGTGLKVFIS